MKKFHYEIIPSVWEHAQALANVMRPADIQEVWAASHQKPLDALAASMAVTPECMTGLANGEVMCIWGVGESSVLSLTGVPWLLGAKKLPKHSKAFLSASKHYMQHYQNKYDKLENYVDARNTLAVKWLGWLGFTIEPPKPFGVENRPFHHFYWHR